MMLFNSSHFLCCSVASFGVSTTSPKNSSFFNISPTIAITFIKCRNCLHMKNNIRYKDTNNTYVIKSKTPSNFTCLGKPPVRLLCCCCSFFIFIFVVVVVSSFVDVLHFVVVLLIAFQHHPSPFRGLLLRFLHPIFYFQPSPSQSELRHFHLFNDSVLAASATALSGHFSPTGDFYLTLLPNIFGTTCFYQGLPGSQQFFLEVCRASY